VIKHVNNVNKYNRIIFIINNTYKLLKVLDQIKINVQLAIIILYCQMKIHVVIQHVKHVQDQVD
jgi:hypothetical protein